MSFDGDRGEKRQKRVLGRKRDTEKSQFLKKEKIRKREGGNGRLGRAIGREGGRRHWANQVLL